MIDVRLPDHPLVNKARSIAEKAHKGQKRKFGNVDFIIHPLRVAASISSVLELDASIQDERYTAIAAALLHDTLEDTNIQLNAFEVFNSIREGATSEILAIVLDLTANHELKGTRIWRKFAMINQIKKAAPLSQLIKLADRLDNLQDFAKQDPEFIKKVYGKESLDLLEACKTLDVSVYSSSYRLYSNKIKDLLDV